MKYLATGLLLSLLTAGCGNSERYINLAAVSQSKTVMVEVDKIIERLKLSQDKNGDFSVALATVSVTVMGAGVYISPNGHVLSCAHLFEGVKVLDARVYDLNGSSVPAALLFMAKDKDLSLVKVARTPFGFATLSSDRLRVGQEVLAVGNPLGLGFSVAHGIISAFRENFDNGYTFTQEDTAINHGNSGGPLFNMSGDLIGINTLKASEGEGIAFAVSPQTIRQFLGLFVGIE